MSHARRPNLHGHGLLGLAFLFICRIFFLTFFIHWQTSVLQNRCHGVIFISVQNSMLTKKVSSSKDDCPKELKTELHLIIFENIKHFYLFRNTCSNNFLKKYFILFSEHLGYCGRQSRALKRCAKGGRGVQESSIINFMGILTY